MSNSPNPAVRPVDRLAVDLPTNGPPPRGLSMPKRLKLKQAQFCEYYVDHGNAARAAREAGYAAANAAHQGGSLLRQTAVRAYIHELRQKYALETRWEMEDAFDKLELIYERAMEVQNYHAAVRAVEAQTRLKIGAIRRINAVASENLNTAPVPHAGVLKRETDHIRRYLRRRPGATTDGATDSGLQDMSPEVMIGPDQPADRR